MSDDQSKPQEKKARDYTRDKITNLFRSFRMKFESTKMHKNIDTLLKFRDIYYELLNQ